MLSAALTLTLLLPQGELWAKGDAAYGEGKYAAAVQAYQAALESRAQDPRLRMNLALAHWRAGQAAQATVEVERAAILAKGGMDARRDGLLGNLALARVRKLAAQSPPAEKLRAHLAQAIEDCGKAATLFQEAYMGMAAGEPGDATAMLRNLQRTRELEERLRRRQREAEEQERQRREQKSQRQQPPKGKPDQDKPGEKPDKPGQENEEESGESEEEKAEDTQPRDPNQKDRPKTSRPEAPGEFDPNKKLSPEQQRRLLRLLAEAEKKLKALRRAQRQRRPKVKKDW